MSENVQTYPEYLGESPFVANMIERKVAVGLGIKEGQWVVIGGGGPIPPGRGSVSHHRLPSLPSISAQVTMYSGPL